MKKEIEVEIPMTPNFIKIGTRYEPITKFTDDELRQIGKEWTEKLINRAKQKRQ